MLKSEIIAAAKKAGFAKAGVAPLYRFDELLPLLNNGEVTPFVKSAERRIDPSLYMKNANRAIVCLMPYFDGADVTVAKYARGGDYHAPVKQRLRQTAEMLGLDTYRLLVDSGGLPDKYLAYLAGLGWYGANNLFYSDELGCRFYIGSILLNSDIEPDSPVENKCLQCGLCIKSCPTGALSEPYRLNPQRCISYLTQADKLTAEQQELITLGKYRLGCDECQDCCPYNKGV